MRFRFGSSFEHRQEEHDAASPPPPAPPTPPPCQPRPHGLLRLVTRQTWSIALIAALLLGLVPVSALAHGRHYNNDDQIETSHPSWMRWLPDTINLAQLSIPGTHDTMSLHGGLAVETHELSLSAQLNAGIRALDIRARHIEARFAIHHGPFYQQAMFGDVLRDAGNFLAAHPSETILMRVKPEHTDTDNTRSFEATFAWYKNQTAYGSYIWTPPANYNFASMPDLGDVRGKIVILQNFDQDHPVFGPIWRDLDIQDSYTVSRLDLINDKWDKVRAQIEKANAGPATTMYVNFLSSARGEFDENFEWVCCDPHIVAGGQETVFHYYTGVNEYALHYLFNNPVRRTGTLMMDFPGAGLIDIIIAQNFRYATRIGGMASDFSTVFNNVAYTTKADDDGDDDARDRLDQMRRFVEHVVPGQRWHLIVSGTPGGDKWGYAIQHEGLYRKSDWNDGYSHVAFNSTYGHSEVSQSTLTSFVESQIDSLSGDAEDRAAQLASRVRSRFPVQYWNVLVKKAPGGFDNWAFRAWGATYFQWHGDYAYVVWGTARNDPPVANAGGPYNANEGSEIIFDASGSTDPDGDTLRYRWDLDNDGTWDTTWSTNSTARRTWNDDYSGSVKVEVSDGQLSHTATATVTVSNVSPTVSVAGARIDENDEATLAGSFADPGSGDTHRLSIDWGDGSTPQQLALSAGARQFSLSHRYLDDNPSGTASDSYTVSITVADDDGGSGSGSPGVTVDNVAPVATMYDLIDDSNTVLAASDVVLVNLPITSTAGFSDIGTLDSRTAIRSWGDGSEAELLGTVTDSTVGAHTYTAAGNYTIAITVTDDDTGTHTATRQVNVVTPAGATNQAIERLAATRSSKPKAMTAIHKALDKLRGTNGERGSNGALDKLESGDLNAALVKLREALQALQAAEAEDPTLDFTSLKKLLTLTAKAAAVDTLGRAEAAEPTPDEQQQIAVARDFVAQGQIQLLGGAYVNAVDHFQDALKRAVSILAAHGL